jgi:hypothetical protein
MFRSAWFLARNDLKHMLRARETLLWTFVMPIIFFFFIGSITKNFGSRDGNTRDPLIVEKAPSAGFLASSLEERLDETLHTGGIHRFGAGRSQSERHPHSLG